MHPPPRMQKPNATIIKKKCNSKNDSKIKKKKKKQFVELVETNPLISNSLKFDQYLRLAIRLNIFSVYRQ